MHPVCGYLPSACPQCKNAEGKVKPSNILWLARLRCGLMYWFMGTVQLWKNVNVSWKYFLAMKTASNCWMSVFCCPARVWNKFEYHNMDLFENFVLHWGTFMCRWVHGSYRCIIFTLKMKMQKTSSQTSSTFGVLLFQYLYFNLQLLNSYW